MTDKVSMAAPRAGALADMHPASFALVMAPGIVSIACHLLGLPLLASALAQELGIANVMVPAHPGLLCAHGLLVADVRSDFSLSRIASLQQTGAEGLNLTMWRGLAAPAGAALGIIDKINVCAAQVVNGYFIHNYFYAVHIEGGVHIAEVVIQCHAEIDAAASATSHIHP